MAEPLEAQAVRGQLLGQREGIGGAVVLVVAHRDHGALLAHADLELVDLPALDDVVVTEPAGDRAGDRVLERRRLVGQAHPDVAQPLPQVDGDQPVLRAVDVLHLREVRRGHERAVEGVGPGVVPALELALAGSRLLHAHARTAVPADVQERAQLLVAAADDQHVFTTHVDGLERAGILEVRRTRSGEPVRLEDLRLLLREDRRVRGVEQSRCTSSFRRPGTRRAVQAGHRTVAGSVALTPYNMPARKRVSANAPRSPRASPATGASSSSGSACRPIESAPSDSDRREPESEDTR